MTRSVGTAISYATSTSEPPLSQEVAAIRRRVQRRVAAAYGMDPVSALGADAEQSAGPGGDEYAPVGNGKAVRYGHARETAFGPDSHGSFVDQDQLAVSYGVLVGGRAGQHDPVGPGRRNGGDIRRCGGPGQWRGLARFDLNQRFGGNPAEALSVLGGEQPLIGMKSTVHYLIRRPGSM